MIKILCWLFHRKHRCYPEVWKVKSTYWHCNKCHPCGEELNKFLKNQVDLDPEAKKVLNDNMWDLM